MQNTEDRKMTTTRGKIQKYLGMTIEYYLPGKVIFSMIDFIGKIIDGILEKMKGNSETLASHHHFYIVGDVIKIF